MLASIRQRTVELRNPVRDGEYFARMRQLFTVREAFATPSEASRVARRARLRYGASITNVFERCGFWRVKVGV